MARSKEQVRAWRDLIELCDDDCAIFETTAEMRSAVIEVEAELDRLHKVEDACVRLVQMLQRIADSVPNGPLYTAYFDQLWNTEHLIRAEVKSLIPQAFTRRAMEGKPR
jgi:hypothetical protein